MQFCCCKWAREPGFPGQSTSTTACAKTSTCCHSKTQKTTSTLEDFCWLLIELFHAEKVIGDVQGNIGTATGEVGGADRGGLRIADVSADRGFLHCFQLTQKLSVV